SKNKCVGDGDTKPFDDGVQPYETTGDVTAVPTTFSYYGHVKWAITGVPHRRYPSQGRCGGALIGSMLHVVTAAHCVHFVNLGKWEVLGEGELSIVFDKLDVSSV
ncbi:uncharacterized protein LOC142356758, partial [Convolutriloba macropyga]|uniref:uncharacterized protein LOC142356758 n=1 Tax=Convolutriloba macropyga TaxID=536237 RepID=UPI003F52569C